VRPQFGHEDPDDVDEYEEVNLNREESIIMPWLRPLCHISRTKHNSSLTVMSSHLHL